MKIKITGIGSYIPEKKVSNTDFDKHVFLNEDGSLFNYPNEIVISKFKGINPPMTLMKKVGREGLFVLKVPTLRIKDDVSVLVIPRKWGYTKDSDGSIHRNSGRISNG